MAARMEAAAVQMLPIKSIMVAPRLRPVDPAAVANLQVSIQETGWFGAVLVRPLPDDDLGPRYELVAGAHRLAAMKGLGRQTIPATIRVLSDDEALQIEIDENLIRRGLTPLERGEMIVERFAVWRRRFPERVAQADGQAMPKRGRPSNSAKFAELSGGAPQTMGFAAETAADVGLSERTVRAAFSTVSNLPADLRAQMRGTPLARNEGLLRQLAAIGDRKEQAKVAELILSGAAKNVADARAAAAGNAPSTPVQTPTDEVLKTFRKLWGSASTSARAAILNDLAGRKLPDGWSVTEADRG
ncbi:MAG: ParB/RepB/Spo0J family partition protein [Phenylobacterium sp.]|uniref:ParB/RepB/Spo0J family partition protein n=1 Tax=Phenylobacterium sp. TaxID=1871053 RepID=UPI00391C6062